MRLHCVVKWKLNSLFAGVAELAVFEQARPVDEEAKFKKAPRSKFIGVTTPKWILGTARVTRSASVLRGEVKIK